jgi:hypothetical protein
MADHNQAGHFLDFHVVVVTTGGPANSERLPEADEVICDTVSRARRFPITPTSIVMVTRATQDFRFSLLGRG